MSATKTTDEAAPWLPAKVYDPLKLMAMIIFPAMGALYFALSGIWGLPDAEKVIGTITAIDAFLGVALAITKAQYLSSSAAYDGHVLLTQDPTTGVQSVKLNVDPNDILNKDKLTLKVGS